MADASATITLSWPEEDVALLTLDMPDKGANILSSHVLEELDAHLDTLEKRSDLAGVVIASAKPGIFIAGADLREFVASLDLPDEEVQTLSRRGQEVFARVQAGPAVSIAVIDGLCLGGGAELATWCDRRLMSDGPRTQIGFPEVKLGLYPGWGATARMPRLVGLAQAVEMVTGGESVSAREAYAMGLAHHLSSGSGEELLAAALRMVRDEQETGQFRRDRERETRPMVLNETELGFLGVTASAVIQQETKGFYPAPMVALNLMLESAGESLERACEMEAEGFVELFGSPVNRALLNVFFLTDRNKKDPGVEDPDTPTSAIRSVGVVGAGIMGAGIAAAHLRRGMSVYLNDAQAEALERGVQSVMEEAAYDREARAATAARAIETAPRLHPCSNVQDLAGCDLVIEAIVENAEIKRKVLQALEEHLDSSALLATNTSTIPIEQLAEGLRRPEQFCGIHFFNPVRKMKLVEVIRGPATADTTVATAVQLCKKLGKHPVVVKDGPGFLVNRLLMPYMNEALDLLVAGASIKEIERAAKAFGMPMGPITLYDVVGLDTALFAGRTMAQAFPDRIRTSALLESLVEDGRLGQKSGSGFFGYGGKKGRGVPDPAIDDYLEQHRTGDNRFTQEEITDHLFLPMVVEAARILEEGIARDPRDVDLALIFGTGFPPFRGGLLYWADQSGLSTVVDRLRSLEEKRDVWAKPTEGLLEMARHKKTFYDRS